MMASPVAPAQASPAAPPGAGPAPTAPMPKFTPTFWSVVVSADRTYFERMQQNAALPAPGLPFPADSAAQRFTLTGTRMRIGRRSAARGVEPEIDLSGPPADPGISRLHALLLPAPDGTWALLDLGSANGTLLNGKEIPAGDLTPLHDGDLINLGAWTAIAVHRE
jgi:pSer/pThr/pTyr-binding forkhead associated (FHA) protein